MVHCLKELHTSLTTLAMKGSMIIVGLFMLLIHNAPLVVVWIMCCSALVHTVSGYYFSLSVLLFDLSLFLFLSVSLCYCLSLSLSFSASLSLSACNENDIRFTSGVSSTHVTSGVRFDSLSGNLEICVAGQYRHVCGLTEVTANPLNIIAAACHQIGYFSKYFFTIIPFMLQCLHV